MTKQVTLSKDEAWLEKEFGVKIDTLDKEVQSGGKKHQAFLDDLQMFKAFYDAMEQLQPKLKSYKPDPGNKDAKKLIDAMLKDHKEAVAFAKKGDVKKACDAAEDYRASYTKLTARKGNGPAVDLGVRMAGTVVR